MWELFFGDNAAWYTVPAIVGTAFFTLRIVLMLVGLGDGDVDINHDFDLDHPDSTHAFHILSIQSIAAFAMGFGWGGLAAYRGTEWGLGGDILAGLITGAAMVWLLAILFRMIADMQSSGNISVSSTVGHEGEVYLTVPAGKGRGQVKLTVNERQRIYNAVSGEEDLPTGTRVRVVKANDDNTLTVARA